MKKLLCCAALLLALCLTACGGNTGGEKVETPDQPQILTPDEPQTTTGSAQEQTPLTNNTQMLVTDAQPLVVMESVKRERYDNDTYYYMDLAGENSFRCINSCYLTSIREGETEEEYAQRRAIGLSVTLSPGNPYNLTVGKSDELSEKLGHPVYLVSFLTGSDLNATCWTVYLTRTEHYSYQYAIAAASQTSLTLEDQIMDYFGTLTLAEMPQA